MKAYAFSRTLRIFLLALAICTIVSIQAIVLPVPQINQNQSNWCWAAVSKSILDYYGYPYSQEQIAQYGTNGANEWNWLWGASTSPTRNGIDLILNHFGSQVTIPYVSAVSLTESTELLNEFKPFVIRWGWSSGGGHFVTAKGIESNTMYLMDPWYGATINSYDWVVSGSSHTWTSSLVMHDPSPVVTVSAPNPSHQQSNVALNTSLNWTNPPNTAFVEVKFGLTNPPQTVIYSGVPIQNLPNSVFPIQLIGNSTYYWQVNSTLQNEVHNSPVWYFSTTHNGLGIQVGNGTLHNSATSYPAPYGNYYAGARHQFLVKASELQQAGMTAGMIRNLAFSVSTAQLTPLHWFSIKIGSASTNSLTAWISGLQTVYGSTTCFSGSGWNIHPFTQPYFWNGTDNLVIETIFNNSGISSNAVFDQTATPGYNSSLFFYVNDIIAGNNGISGSAQQRPNLRFNFSTQLDAIPNLRITRSAGNVLVQWDNVYGANHYQVYSSELPNPSDWGAPIATVTTNSYSEAHQSKRFYRIVATTN